MTDTVTEIPGTMVFTRKRAETIYNAWENWLNIGFHAGDLWHHYELKRSVLRCFYEREEQVKYTWNVRDVLISQDWLTIVTDTDMEIRFRIKEESR